MKKILLHAVFALFAFAFAIPVSAQIFVKQNATGANTGASWADAYTNLQTALAAAAEGDEIWVAAGIYKPAAPGGDPTSNFLINKNIQLLGGFVGTETSADQRDPAANVTILSGDLNGDDVDDDFSSAYRSDNVGRVVRFASATNTATILDGFVIEGGQADGGTNIGAGIYCSGAPTLRNCVIRQNFSLGDGAGLYVVGASAQGLVVEKCRFEKNQAIGSGGSAHGGGMVVSNVKGVGFEIRDCEFVGNRADWMGGLSVTNSNGILEGTTFADNSTPRHGGGLRVYSVPGNNDLHFTVRNCTFENNKASFGGGMYVSLQSQNCNVEVVNSKFIGNAVEEMNLTGWGQSFGGLGIVSTASATNLSISVDSCQFESNTSSFNHSALGIEPQGANTVIAISNSIFKANETTGFLATMGIWPYATANVTVENCLFENNASVYSAGLDIGPYSYSGSTNYTIRNCHFLNNHASSLGGALTLWGDTGSLPNFNIEDCLMENNSAGERAGAIWILTSSDDFQANLSRCKILDNISPWGSAIGNFQGGLVYYFMPDSAVVSIENSLIEGNTGGAAIALDSFPGLQLLNTTVANNHGGIQLSDKSGLTLQNTIFHNPDYTEYQALTVDVTFTSLGGNLIGDLSLDGQLTPSDKYNLAPLFVGPDDYRLTAGSPCVDAGNNDGVTTTLDIDGSPRIQGLRVDMGAYESGFTRVREVIAGEVAVSPNPAVAFLNIRLPENGVNPFGVQVFDAQGKLLQNQMLAEGQTLDVQGLEAGMYALKVVAGGRVFVGKFVKQ